MKINLKLATVGGIALLTVAGCKKTADNTVNYKSAINDYYTAHPSCLYAESQTFPTQVDTSDKSKTQPFDALVDQGLLARTTDQKTRLLGLVSKQVTNYDLSDKGRSAWTASTTDPGSGNFCYGHRSVDSIISSTPNNGEVGATTTVDYKWTFSGAPDWAKATETQNAFPKLATDLAGNGNESATLVDSSNGWKLQGGLSGASNTQ